MLVESLVVHLCTCGLLVVSRRNAKRYACSIDLDGDT